MVVHSAVNREVVGSSPTSAAKNGIFANYKLFITLGYTLTCMLINKYKNILNL